MKLSNAEIAIVRCEIENKKKKLQTIAYLGEEFICRLEQLKKFL